MSSGRVKNSLSKVVFSTFYIVDITVIQSLFPKDYQYFAYFH